MKMDFNREKPTKNERKKKNYKLIGNKIWVGVEWVNKNSKMLDDKNDVKFIKTCKFASLFCMIREISVFS